jgi:hypothetical protein
MTEKGPKYVTESRFKRLERWIMELEHRLDDMALKQSAVLDDLHEIKFGPQIKRDAAALERELDIKPE